MQKDIYLILKKFVIQAQKGELKTASYQKEMADLRMRISFGMGAPARVPWIAFIAPEMHVSQGFYPVYLYYKDLQTLILAYGVSETEESLKPWPSDIMNNNSTIEGFFDRDVPRYGDSFVYKAYKINTEGDLVNFIYSDTQQVASEKDLEIDLKTILDYYKKILSIPSTPILAEINQGIFYMEKQLEDFIIYNWENTELGKRFDLIIEEGVLKSQQFRTDIGPIDILVRDKKTKGYVIIELKKNQTSDDTVGQIARYMGWVWENMGGNVQGIIIAGEYDRKLEYALKMVPNVEVFLYEVDFKLKQFKKK